MSDPKFKVGDKVRCKAGYTSREDSGGVGYVKGRRFIIKDITSAGGNWIYWAGTGNTKGVYEKALSLMTPAITKDNKTIKKTMKKPLRTGIIKKGDAYIQADAYSVLEKCVEMKEPALLIGETGVGKTTVVRELAKDREKTLVRISLNGSTGVEEILGKWLADKGTTIWQDGILLSAMKAGHWVVMDEINAALPEILFTLHSLLDDDRSVVLAEKDNEVVKPHEEFRFFSTMNPPEDYAGTKDLNKALISRFTAILNIHPLKDVDETSLLTDMYGVPADISYRLVDMANKLRKAKQEDKIFYFCSTRDLVQAGKLLGAGLDLNLAVAASVINKMTKDEVKEVKKVFEEFSTTKAPTMSYSEIIKYAEDLENNYSKLQEDYVLLEKAVEKIRTDIVSKVGTSIKKTVQELKEEAKKEAEALKKSPVKKAVKKA